MMRKELMLNILVIFFLFGAVILLFTTIAYAQGKEEIQSKKTGKRSMMKEFIGPNRVPMVLVPAGEFIMGSNDWRKDEKPRRKVYLDGFYLDKYPVTNNRFRLVGMIPEGEYGPKFDGKNQPVVGISWSQAKDYCTKVGKRMPTEAEWEKGARGTDGRMYPWGDGLDRNKLILEDNSNGRTHHVDRNYNTHKSPFGAVDLEGNVTEWVSDWYGKDYYHNAPIKNPKGPSSGTYRVIRGGSFKFSFFGFFRISARGRIEPVNYKTFIGFRCAKTMN